MTTGPSAAVGTLASRPLSHLLIYSLDNELNGSLELVGADGVEAGIIMMARGCPAKIRSSGPDAFLGWVLCELGYLAEADIEPSLNEAIAQGLPHGQLLVGSGAITPEQLVRGLREQGLRKLAHLFTLSPDTTFAFHDGLDLLADYGGGELVLTDPFPALWWSIRDLPTPDHVSALIARAAGARFQLARGERTDRFKFGPEEAALLQSLRVSDMGIAELSALRVLPQQHVELFVYCLLITKQIEVSGAGAAIPAAPTSARSVGPASVRSPAAQATPSRSQIPAAKPPSNPPQSRSPASLQPSSGELSPREKAIVDRARAIKSEDYFQRLSVGRDATVEQIDGAFTAVSRLWDASALPQAVREPGKIVHAGLVEAHETLRDQAKREIYVKKLLLGIAHVPDPAVDLAESGADNEVDGAKACLAKGDYDRAERLVRRALKAKPDNAPVMALAAWIEAQRPTNQTTEATRARILKLDRAVRQDPECEEALYFRAMLYMRIENFLAAQRDLAELVELNPEHRDAPRELRICEERSKDQPRSRKGAKAAPAGFFDRLLKK